MRIVKKLLKMIVLSPVLLTGLVLMMIGSIGIVCLVSGEAILKKLGSV